MKDIICPHCHKAFKVDEAGYADILKQVRNSEFEEQLHQRLDLAEKKSSTRSNSPKRKPPAKCKRPLPLRKLKSRN